MRRTSFLTLVGLLLLRLAIGWHFFIEGFQKANTWGWADYRLLNPLRWWHAWRNDTEVRTPPPGKPFTSEPYLRESTGPIGPYYREHVLPTDPDDRALALLTPKPLAEDADPVKVPPQDRVPDALSAEWDAYFERFAARYSLSEAERKDAEGRLRQAKAQLGLWLTATPESLSVEVAGAAASGSPFVAAAVIGAQPVPGAQPVQKPYKTGTLEVPQTTSERVAEYRKKVDEFRTVRSARWAALGKPVDQEWLGITRADAARMRKELLDDLDAFTKAMKDSLGAVVKNRLADFAFRDEDEADPYDALLASVTDVGDDGLPKKLSARWDAYKKVLADTYKLDDARKQTLDAKEEEAKARTAAWFEEQNTEERWFTPPSKARVTRYVRYVEELRQVRRDNSSSADARSAEAKAETARKSLQADVNKQNDAMKRTLGAALNTTEASAWVPEPEPKWWKTLIGWLDVLTVIGVTLIGVGLLLGLFTRFSALMGIVFLLLTFLSYPPFPWLPLPPNTEGNPVYINKNIIELAGLLVLATTTSGRWLGLDALVHWFFVERRQGKQKAAAAAKVKTDRRS
jgi:uncharacterized membrane protein YphA (DoxX/SURF4 family)